MIGKSDPMQALRLYVDLKKRADSGDPKAKAEIAKIAANPTAVAVLRETAQRVKSAAAMQLADAITSAPVLGHEKDDYEPGADDLEDADRMHHQLPPGSDDLDHKSFLRKMRQSTMNAIAPAVSINPPSAFTGTLGNSATVKNGDNPQQVALWQDDSPNARAVSVAFTAAFKQGLSEAGAVKPFGIITFGNRGFVGTAEVDIAQGGTQLTVPASAITLQVGMDQAVAGENATSMLLSGEIAFGTITRTAPVTRTLYLDEAQTVASGALRIPAFAKSVWVQKSHPNDTIQLEIQNAGLDDLNVFTLPAAATNVQQTSPILLPNDAFFVSVTGGSGFGKVRLIFELGI